MLGSYGRMFDDDDVVKLLQSRVEAAGGQSAFARQTGVDRAHLNRVLKGMRAPTVSLLDALNLRIVYAPSSRRTRQRQPPTRR